MDPEKTPQDWQRLWRSVVDAVGAELAALAPEERASLRGDLETIRELQEELHLLFLAAGGAGLCAACDGECCGLGRHHLTLANLLPFLLAAEEPPPLDFGRTCPLLGDGGCILEAGRRPYNCVTFLCEAVEERLTPADRERFGNLETDLRRRYGDLESRYAGAGMRGLLLRAETLAGRPFLGPPPMARGATNKPSRA